MSAQRLKLVSVHQAILPPFSRLDFQHFPTEQFSCRVQYSLKKSSIFHLRWSTDLLCCLHIFFFIFSLAPCMCCNEEWWWWWWCGSPWWAVQAQNSKQCLAFLLSTVSKKILCTFCAEIPGRATLHDSLHSLFGLLDFQQHAFIPVLCKVAGLALGHAHTCGTSSHRTSDSGNALAFHPDSKRHFSSFTFSLQKCICVATCFCFYRK